MSTADPLDLLGNRSICEEGDSFTEPYIAGHNVLNAHARAVWVYRSRYKSLQGGMISITLNCDWPMVGGHNDQTTTEMIADMQCCYLVYATYEAFVGGGVIIRISPLCILPPFLLEIKPFSNP